MRKIRLELEELAVESFSTDGGNGKRAGTVRGNDYTGFEGCVISGMSDCATCAEGCPADTLTCFASCRMTNGGGPCIDPNC